MHMSSTFVHLPVPADGYLCGFSGPARVPAGNTSSALEANIALFSDGNQKLAILSVDVAYPNELHRQLRQMFSGSEIEFITLASHTHYAPSMVPEYPSLGRLSEVFIDDCVKIVEGAVGKLSGDLGKLSASDVSTISPFVVRHHPASRRRRFGIAVQRRPLRFTRTIVRDPSSDQPENVQVLVSMLITGNTRTIIWSFACHPADYFDSSQVSSEYIGYVRDALRNKYGLSTPVVFFQGASGDLRQPFSSKKLSKVGIAKFLLRVIPSGLPSYCAPEKNEWMEWCEKLAVTVLDAAAEAEQLAVDQVKLTVSSGRCPTTQLFDQEHSVKELDLHKIGLSDNINLLVINAEITGDFEADIFDHAPHGDSSCQIASCANECLGYLSTSNQFRDGGYESVEWPPAFGLTARTTPRTGDAAGNMIQDFISGCD